MMIIYFLSLLFPFSTHATCTPTPDCADMGYTETSCSGSFVRCPFDTSKLFCAPCDSKFQYLCSGDYITAGAGSSCDNKYVSCECVAGATFSNGNCMCDTSCKVGNIYYSDTSCSSCLENNKTPVGVVVKDNEIIMSIEIQYQLWSSGYKDIPNLPNYATANDALNDFSGKSNTATIVAYYGANADTSTNAGVYCYNYAPSSLSSSKNSWYLPAVGELYNYYTQNYSKINPTLNLLNANTAYKYFWSSSEYVDYAAWATIVQGEHTAWTHKHDYKHCVTCFLSIN